MHHLISRFTNREWRLLSERDRDEYRSHVERATSRSDTRVHAYGLMSSHTHLSAVGAADPLGSFLHSLNTTFGRWWNETHDGLGRVFAERPKSIVIASEEQLARLVAYIHNNPVRAGVTSDPAESPWTSHRAYIGERAEQWLQVEWALAAMGFSASPSGRASFHDYVCSRATMPRDPTLAGRGPLGEDFGGRLLRAVARQAGIPPEQVRHPGSNVVAIQARRLMLSVGIGVFGASGERLARELGLSEAMISRLRREAASDHPPSGRQLQEIVDLYLDDDATPRQSKCG